MASESLFDKSLFWVCLFFVFCRKDYFPMSFLILTRFIEKWNLFQVNHYERRIRTLENEIHESKDQRRKALEEVNFVIRL